MTTTNGQVANVVEGVVESVNDHGIKVSGEWRNVSKFNPVELPGRGTRVRLELDAKGFIRELEVLDSKLAEQLKTGGVSAVHRDRTITRLSVLKTAAAFLAQMGQVHEGVKSEHVIPLAERWLEWVEQDGGADVE